MRERLMKVLEKLWLISLPCTGGVLTNILFFFCVYWTTGDSFSKIVIETNGLIGIIVGLVFILGVAITLMIYYIITGDNLLNLALD